MQVLTSLIQGKDGGENWRHRGLYDFILPKKNKWRGVNKKRMVGDLGGVLYL